MSSRSGDTKTGQAESVASFDGLAYNSAMKRLGSVFATVLLAQMVLGQDTKPRDMHEMHKLHQDPKAYIAMLDDPARDEYQKPHEVITALGLKPGEAIADIGAGSGYFTFRLAHHVGDTGRVYAVDISPEMILHLNRRIHDLQVKNVISILSSPDDSLLSDASINLFF